MIINEEAKNVDTVMYSLDSPECHTAKVADSQAEIFASKAQFDV